jgi:hypothetical protein
MPQTHIPLDRPLPVQNRLMCKMGLPQYIVPSVVLLALHTIRSPSTALFLWPVEAMGNDAARR